MRPAEAWLWARRAASLIAAAALVSGLAMPDVAQARPRGGYGRATYAKTTNAKTYGASRASRRAAARQEAAKAAAAKVAAKTRAAAPAEKPVPVPVDPAAPPAPPPAATLTGQALVPIAMGGITSTSARMASDLATVLDGQALRVLPVMARGSLDDVVSLAKADKIDLAFLHSDALATLPPAERAGMSARIAYVARLYNEEVHIVARRDVNDLRELAGKKVNVGPQGSANAQTAELVFNRLGIVPHYIYLDQPTALAQLASGEIAGDVLVSGRPVKALQDFAGGGRFKLMSIPYDPALQDIYLPAKIEGADYGNLVPPGTNVDTLAVAIVLATIDAPSGSLRAARVARFTQAMFDRFSALRDPTRHPKWREVNLAAEVANWTRFAAAQEAIARGTARSVGLGAPPAEPNGR